VSELAIAIACFGLGAVVALAARALLGGPTARERELEDTLAAERDRHAQHRESVDKHFEETAQLFQDLSYQHALLYRHLSQGMRELCGNPEKMLARGTPDAVLLEPRIAGEESPELAEADAEDEPEPDELGGPAAAHGRRTRSARAPLR
jgi:uncharacterized protein